MRTFLPGCLMTACCALLFFSTAASSRASIAYGSINNFDTVNDTGKVCHGFEIEIEDCPSLNITYTYNYNHYGVPLITEDNSVPGHPKCVIRWESKKNADGSWASHTAIPSGPIAPTDGHMFTDPSVNFGGEHFGVGYSVAVGAVRYNWLVDDGSGKLMRGGAVQISTPAYTYNPPQPGVAAQVQAVIQPPPAPVAPAKEFGPALWMKEIRTTSHNNQEIRLRELVSDDPNQANEKNWANGEPDEVEVEWQLLQKDYGKADGGANNEIAAAPQDLPNNDEVVTRRYEFFKYTGPLDNETGEAMADTVAADGVHGSGAKVINGTDVDLTEVVVVGDYVGAQMAAVDVEAPVGLIDHVGEGRVGTAFAERRVVVMGAQPFVATLEGSLPPGMMFDEVTGILSGTPDASGSYQFKVTASDTVHPDVAKSYTLVVVAAGMAALPSALLDTTSSPVNGGTTTGDGSYEPGAPATVTAAAADGFVFVNWTDNGQVVSVEPSHTLTMDVNHSLVANFSPAYTVGTSSLPAAGGTTQGGGTFSSGETVTVAATPAPGYVFTHWSEAGGQVSASAVFTFSIASPRDLVAHFSQGVSYNITTSSLPAAGGTTTGAGVYADGFSVTLNATAAAGYSFMGWTRGGTLVSTAPTRTFTATGDDALVANFAVISGVQRTVTLLSTPAGAGTTSGGGVYADGASVTVTAAASAGYRFSKWKDGSATVSSAATYAFTANADRVLTAVFVPAYYITATAGPEGGGTTEVDSANYKLDDTAKVFAYPAAGYQFVNWTENGVLVSTVTPYSFRVTGNRDLVASFAPVGGVAITCTALPVSGGSVEGGGSYAVGEAVRLTALAAPDHVFLNWTENGTLIGTSPLLEFPAAASRTLVANFAAGHKVSAACAPVVGGNVSGAGFVPSGATASLAAVPNPGYAFVSWVTANGSVVGTDPSLVFVPVEDTSLTAQFEALPKQALIDFDTGVPALVLNQEVPLSQTNAVCTATFTSAMAGSFRVAKETGTERVLTRFEGQHLECVVDGAALTITFDQPLTGVSVDFATMEASGAAVPASLQLTALDHSSGNPVTLGVAIAHGVLAVGDTLPVGTLNFNAASGSFDQITLELPGGAEGAARFLLDNLSITTNGSTGGTLQLSNPAWNITLTDFGYSDFLLDNTPGFEGREYLSGEWGSAVAYVKAGAGHTQPRWLQPDFLFPDWRTNSDFRVVVHIHSAGSNADGLPIAESVIANNDLEITQRYEMLDTVTGTPMGVTPASSSAPPRSINSNRYVLRHAFSIKNISGVPISGLQLFQLLHGFISQQGQYDDRTYPGQLAEYCHDITMSGLDASAAGAQSSATGLEDLIGFHSKLAPTAFEMGHYGVEGNGVDDHSLGKPSDGVHLSIEDNWASAPFAARKNRDFFAPQDRWLAGAQRWELGSLAPGESVSFDLLLSLLTGTKVGSTGAGGGGSCQGGASHAGGVDFEFENITEAGTFFGDYSEADDRELLEREREGEFALPTFNMPEGQRRQRWNLSYSGVHTGSIRLRFAYDPALLPAGFDENQLSIYHFNHGAWEKLAGKVDARRKVIEAVTPSLSPFMLGINDQVVRPDVRLSASTPGAFEVSWDASFTGWQLQESSDLASWTVSTRAVTTENGTTSTTVPISSGARFFRLQRP